jgi:hypothetical protein
MTHACADSKHAPLAHADIGVIAVAGERRVVAYRLFNRATAPIVVTPTLSLVHDASTGAPVTPTPWTVQPAAPFSIPPGDALEVRIILETSGLLVDHAYRAELSISGAQVEPITVVVAVERPEALVGRHDRSRLRAFIEGHCLGREPTALFAPGQHLRCCPPHHACGGHHHGGPAAHAHGPGHHGPPHGCFGPC